MSKDVYSVSCGRARSKPRRVSSQIGTLTHQATTLPAAGLHMAHETDGPAEGEPEESRIWLRSVMVPESDGVEQGSASQWVWS